MAWWPQITTVTPPAPKRGRKLLRTPRPNSNDDTDTSVSVGLSLHRQEQGQSETSQGKFTNPPTLSRSLELWRVLSQQFNTHVIVVPFWRSSVRWIESKLGPKVSFPEFSSGNGYSFLIVFCCSGRGPKTAQKIHQKGLPRPVTKLELEWKAFLLANHANWNFCYFWWAY